MSSLLNHNTSRQLYVLIAEIFIYLQLSLQNRQSLLPSYPNPCCKSTHKQPTCFLLTFVLEVKKKSCPASGIMLFPVSLFTCVFHDKTQFWDQTDSSGIPLGERSCYVWPPVTDWSCSVQTTTTTTTITRFRDNKTESCVVVTVQRLLYNPNLYCHHSPRLQYPGGWAYNRYLSVSVFLSQGFHLAVWKPFALLKSILFSCLCVEIVMVTVVITTISAEWFPLL